MNQKDVIYVDVEDEITGIIDKVSSSKSKIVALVLPKRAAVFQSVVNLKLLKKRADFLKKKIVLVTSDNALLPVIGVVGLHVAKTLQDQPVIPKTPDIDDGKSVDVDDEPEDAEIDNTKPIGELAGLAAVGSTVARPNSLKEDESIEVDNTTSPEDVDMVGSAAAELTDKKAKKNKKLRVPNFNKFRNTLIISVVVIILLVVGYIYAFKIAPRAVITIQTNTSQAHSSLSLTLSASQASLDPVNNVVPAKVQTAQKTDTSQSVATTGQKTVGTAATGTITVTIPTGICHQTNCTSEQDSIPAGTVFTDPNDNLDFASNSAVTIPGYSCHFGSCPSSTVTIPAVAVTATEVGTDYNIASENNYTSQGTTANGTPMSAFNMSGSVMSGGSSQQVQVVAQADVSSAETQLSTPSTSTEEQSLETSLQQAGLIPITSTFVSSPPTYAPSAAIGVEADNITVTATYNYSMYGVKENDLETLIDNNVNQQINPTTQGILESGAGSASFIYQSTNSNSVLVTMSAESTIGPKLNSAALLKQVAGEKSGDIKNSIEQVPGVTNVTIKYSPFWVTLTPKNTSKITIIIEKKDGSAA